MILTDIFQTIILLGAVQGFIISGLLFFLKGSRQSNRLLAALIFLMALASSCLYASFKNWFDSDIIRLISDIVPLIVAMPFGPLIFFYVRSSLDPDFKMGKKQRIHFYPVIIDIIPNLTAIVFIGGVLLGLIANNPRPWGIFIDDYNVYSDIPRWMSVTIYLWFSEKYLSSLKAGTGGAGSEAKIKWLRQFIRVFLAFQLIWLVYLVPYVIPRYTGLMLDTFDWYPVYVPLAVLIYWLGIKGYLMSHRYTAGFKAKENSSQEIATETIRHTSLLLKKAMEEDKLFLNPSLNLQIMSTHTGIAQKTISAVLNQHLHKSFNEFINEYRVNEVKSKMLQPESKLLSIAGLAYEAGFNSLPTFQRAFRTCVNMTPKEFLSLTEKTKVNNDQIRI